MITLGYADIILTGVAMCAVVFTAAMVSAVLMLRSTSSDVRRALQSFQELDATLRATQRVADKAERILDDVEAVTDETRCSAIPVIRAVGRESEELLGLVRHIAALVAGARAGLGALGGSNTPQ